MSTPIQVRPGDFVWVLPAPVKDGGSAGTGVRRGVYIVLATGPGGINVITPTGDVGTKLQLADIVIVWRPESIRGDRLPEGVADISQPPQPISAPPKAVPEPPMKFQLVSVPTRGRLAIEMVRYRTPSKPAMNIRMECFETSHLNRNTSPELASRLAVWVPEDLLERLLAAESGCYVIDPAGLGHLPPADKTTFVTDGAWQR